MALVGAITLARRTQSIGMDAEDFAFARRASGAMAREQFERGEAAGPSGGGVVEEEGE